MASPARKISQNLASIPHPTGQQIGVLTNFLKLKTGIQVSHHRLERVIDKTRGRISEIGLADWESYLALIQRERPEFLTFVSLATINKTLFFREPVHFEILRQHFDRYLQTNPDKPFRCWSGACSSGEEVYSIAMTLAQVMKHNETTRRCDFRILGSDIDQEILRQAKLGVYTESTVNDEVPRVLIPDYFQKGTGSNIGLYRVCASLRSRIKFRLINLIDEQEDLPVKFDAIFLRNVLIYFDEHSTMVAVKRMLRNLKKGGLLVLGHCESLPKPIEGLKSIGASIHQKTSEE